MDEKAQAFHSVHLDFGTGDGAFVLRAARAAPGVLFLGTDAAAEPLRDASHRASRKPARGGVENAIFGLLSLENAPAELAGIADALTVHLPWGTLLKTVARGERDGLRALRALCRDGACVRVIFGYGSADARRMDELSLPALDSPRFLDALAGAYGEAGFDVRGRRIDRDEVRALSTTWAATLAFSSSERTFIELAGSSTRCSGAPSAARRGGPARR